MEQYINKSAVVAEIERYKHKADERLKIKGRTLAEDCKDSALQNLCGNLLHFLDTLEVKEVDLGKVYDDFLESRKKKGYMLFEVAKHFFELGMAVSNPTTASDKDLDDEIIPTLLTRD